MFLSRKYDYYSTCIRVKVFLFHWAKLESAGSQSYTYFHEKLRTKLAESAGKKNMFLNRSTEITRAFLHRACKETINEEQYGK